MTFSGSASFASNWNQNSNVNFSFGSSNQGSLEFDTAETNDTVKIGLASGGGTSGTGTLLIVEQADKDTNFGIPNSTDPNIRIQSADATTVTDYVQIFHNQTDGNITTGGGNLNLAPAGGVVDITGALNLTPQASPPGSPSSGDLYVDSSPAPDELCFYDGSAWQAVISGTDANCA
jgi:hypothetical protein